MIRAPYHQTTTDSAKSTNGAFPNMRDRVDPRVPADSGIRMYKSICRNRNPVSPPLTPPRFLTPPSHYLATNGSQSFFHCVLDDIDQRLGEYLRSFRCSAIAKLCAENEPCVQ